MGVGVEEVVLWVDYLFPLSLLLFLRHFPSGSAIFSLWVGYFFLLNLTSESAIKPESFIFFGQMVL